MIILVLLMQRQLQLSDLVKQSKKMIEKLWHRAERRLKSFDQKERQKREAETTGIIPTHI